MCCSGCEVVVAHVTSPAGSALLDSSNYDGWAIINKEKLLFGGVKERKSFGLIPD